MQRQGGGSIINISSIGARCALSRRLAYCTSKAAVEQFTRTLAFEWSTYGIRVNAIAPGYVESDMNADLRADPERVQEILADVPMGRLDIRRICTAHCCFCVLTHPLLSPVRSSMWTEERRLIEKQRNPRRGYCENTCGGDFYWEE